MYQDPFLRQVTVDFDVANLPLKRRLSFGRFEIVPMAESGVLYPATLGPGIHWEISARGRYRASFDEPRAASAVADEYIAHDDALHLLLTFARGSYVPLLRARLVAQTLDNQVWTRSFSDAGVVAPRSGWPIYDNEDELVKFLTEAHPKVLDPSIGYEQNVRSALFLMSMAFDHEWVENQFFVAWQALEVLIQQPDTRKKIVPSGSQFDKKIRPLIERVMDEVLPRLLGQEPDAADLVDQAKSKIGELNRPPIIETARKFFVGLGEDVDRQTLQGYIERRNRIGHTGLGWQRMPLETVSLELHKQYRDEMNLFSWQLFNLIRSAILRMLVDGPLLTQLLQGAKMSLTEVRADEN